MLAGLYYPQVIEEREPQSAVGAHPPIPLPLQQQQATEISWDLGVVKDCAGSASIKLGGSFVICSINGPRSFQGGRGSAAVDGAVSGFSEKGSLTCEVKFGSHLRPANDSHEDSSSEGFLASTARTALEPVTRLDVYPKSVISITAVVMQSSDHDLAAVINCATLALVDAAIELRDLVTAVSIRVPGDIPTVLTMALAANLDEITQLSWTGRLAQSQAVTMMAHAKEKCSRLRKVMQEHLVHYVQIGDSEMDQ